MKSKEEHYIQCQIVKELRKNNIMCFAVPNGIFFNAKSKLKGFLYMEKLKAEGFTPGVADLVIVLQDTHLYVEVKTPKGEQSDNQKQFQAKIESLGYPYQLWRSVEDAEKFVKGIKGGINCL